MCRVSISRLSQWQLTPRDTYVQGLTASVREQTPQLIPCGQIGSTRSVCSLAGRHRVRHLRRAYAACGFPWRKERLVAATSNPHRPGSHCQAGTMYMHCQQSMSTGKRVFFDLDGWSRAPNLVVHGITATCPLCQTRLYADLARCNAGAGHFIHHQATLRSSGA